MQWSCWGFNAARSILKELKMQEDSTLTKMILSPALSGVYISKSDLQAVGASCGYSLQLQERKRMLKELFALVQGVEDFVRIIDAFKSFVAYKDEQYKSVASEYPATATIVDSFSANVKNALNELEKAKEEAALIA
jgi:hypothetical protein